MATTINKTLGAISYEKIVDSAENFFLSIPKDGTQIEVICSDSVPLDSIDGHQIRGRDIESLSRTVFESGNIYARSLCSGPAKIILTTW